MGQERIAVTVWRGRMSPVLDVSTRALLLTVEDGRVLDRAELDLPETGGAKLAALANRGVGTLLCGAASHLMAQQAASFGLRLVPFLAGTIEEVVTAYLAGRLPHPSLSMPGATAGGEATWAGAVTAAASLNERRESCREEMELDHEERGPAPAAARGRAVEGRDLARHRREADRVGRHARVAAQDRVRVPVAGWDRNAERRM